MSDDERIEQLELENKILQKNNKGLKAKIDEQSKEIEELNLENIELKQSKIVDKNSIPNQDNFYDCYNFIHKDKIKAKIEELDYNDIGNFERRCKQEVLQSLLEKE